MRRPSRSSELSFAPGAPKSAVLPLGPKIKRENPEFLMAAVSQKDLLEWWLGAL